MYIFIYLYFFLFKNEAYQVHLQLKIRMKKIIAQGAEAKIILDRNKIIKDRFIKTYRIKILDDKLRKFRTKREVKILEKLSKIQFPIPKLIGSSNSIIEMTLIKGKILRDVLENDNCAKLCSEIGVKIGILHNNQIIHSDLTTSNMILKDEIYFIDFGLSFFSHKIEDKAVDLHLLRESLESKHHKICKKCFDNVLIGYCKKATESNKILKRLKIVESRGRYKGKK